MRQTGLPYVSRIVTDVMAAYQQVTQLRRQLEGSPESANVAQLERDYETQMQRLSDLVDELHSAGVELKDFEKGLIDFPAIFEGREVLLCWHEGEPQVDHWHEVDAGFAGRQSVALLADAAE